MDYSYGFFIFALATLFNMLCYGDHILDILDPVDGFTPIPLTQANFEVQRPYNIPLDKRYTFRDGVRRLWVYAKDKPHFIDSHTLPRTEIGIMGAGYSSGIRQFEGYAYVPKGTSGVTIFQIFGAPKHTHATTLQLRVYNGNLMHYNWDVVATQIYDKWFRLNVIHDVNGGMITIFIDGVKKYITKDRGPGNFSFKFGVYASSEDSYMMESRWKNVKIYKK